MTVLKFKGTDYRDLIGVLIEAIKITGTDRKQPSVEVNGKVLALSELPGLLSYDEPMQPHHQKMLYSIFSKPQHSYGRAAQNLVTRINEVLTGRDRVMALAAMKPSVQESQAELPYKNRGFSARTIKALIDCSIDAPERLLFMTEESLRKIPGVGKASLGEIMRYRTRYLGEV
jgi:hypothetical protein